MIDSIASPYIHDGNADSFESQVLANSQSGPVLVSFWSKKTGPSLRQYPILDKLIHHYQGKVLLININADSEVKICKAWGVNSVPTLKLFRYGDVVKTLHGFQSENDLAQLLDQYVARESDQVVPEAIQLYVDGKTIEAHAALTDAILQDPVNPRLPLALCKLLVHEQRYEEAINLLMSLPPEIGSQTEIRQLQDQLSFYEEINGINDIQVLHHQLDTEPDNVQVKMQLASYYAINQDYEAALSELSQLMDIDPGFRDNAARSAMLTLFRILGEEHVLTKQYRPCLRVYSH